MVSLRNDVVEEIKSQTRGKVLLPADPGYEEARQIWNAMINRRPAMIVQCAGVADIIRSVAFAREHRLPVSVRGGGHNIAGNALSDGGLTIDLSMMKSVRVNPETRRAYVEPGATLADFDHEAQAFGLATPLGINSTTGVAGLTLGGGFGWLTRKYGMTIDNLISAEVVTADGQRVRASKEENPDLFWALRGGGGNFGIVSLFEFQLHPVGPKVLSGLIVFPFDQAKEVLTKYRKAVDKMPDDLSVWVVLRKAPPLPFLPKEVHGKEVVVFAILYAGKVEEGKRLIEPLHRFGRPHGEHIGPMPYTAWQKAFDPLLAPGARNYWKSHNFSQLSDGALDTVIEYAGRLPSPHCEIFFGLIGGQASRIAPDATAYAHRETKIVMNVHGRWEKPEEDKQGIAWARAFFNAAAPYATGSVYVNFLTEEESARVVAAYGPNYDRLAQIKNNYDPENFFNRNQNIKPAA
ncbi:MAG: FAD-binding oxidoreductase [Candidatus Manganitrophus sp. SA1]|nr:FAD-binding oxidoreductase [Candidatus Manganitrophus morganii]